jgi:tRNA(Ile)-lysidine synthase
VSEAAGPSPRRSGFGRAGGPAIRDREFRDLMERLGPFEPAPVLAVALSGGADSMALALLADRWARRRRGRIVALTVDHGLRPGSRAEARAAHARLAALGIEAGLLVWRGAKPQTGIQAAAREARYRLMSGWCRRHGVLHLLLAHHREDQAETLLHRLGRASGGDGLAGMAAIRELPEVRLLRPCLTVPRDRLRAVLAGRRMSWAEDPSNRDPAFARVRLRFLLPRLAEEGIDAAALSLTARRMGSVRAALETGTARFLARHAALYPEGYAVLDPIGLAAAAPEIALRALERLLGCIGGAAYPPRHARLIRLLEALRDGGARRPRTLGGCRILPFADRLLIVREAARCEVLSAAPGEKRVWDGRFLVNLPGHRGKTARKLTIRALSEAEWAEIRREPARPGGEHLPAPVGPTLPAIFAGRRLLAVPLLGYDRGWRHDVNRTAVEAMLFPANPATSGAFPVA